MEARWSSSPLSRSLERRSPYGYIQLQINKVGGLEVYGREAGFQIKGVLAGCENINFKEKKPG